ncbi:snipper [Brevipalpus obovatus]|uniref:snipper n=1 Tax=Brevipalpus obovatus TaxID=246614 RepID=UPI003D9F5BA7
MSAIFSHVIRSCCSTCIKSATRFDYYYFKSFSHLFLLKMNNYNRWFSSFSGDSATTQRVPGKSQKFDYLLVLDFEGTCDSPEQIDPNEIIEFPVLCLKSPEMNLISTFHQYVRPKINPQLRPFCIRLTGIIQDQVDVANEFPQVLSDFDRWIKSGFGGKDPSLSKSGDDYNFAFVTCGNWDLQKMLPLQCKLSNVNIPDYMTRWINLKAAFSKVNKRWPKHMTDMADHYGIVNEGRLHSGYDDCVCISNIVKRMAKDGYDFEITNVLKPPRFD